MTTFLNNAKRIYNNEIKMFQYIEGNGNVLITSKTEKGIETAWKKYKNVWN